MNRIILGLLVVAIALFAAVPAQAVSVPGCFSGDFLLFARDILNFEKGATNLTGDVILLNGTVGIGAKNIINGTVFADSIFLGTDAVVAKCVANSISGPGTCTDATQVGPGNFVPPVACAFPPLTPPTFPAACLPGGDKTITAPGGSLAANDCFNKIRVNKDAKLTLPAGSTVFAKTEFKLLNGASVESDTPGSPANILTNRSFLSEAAISIKDTNITSLGGPGNNVHIGLGSTVENSVIFSPFGEIHLHTGSRLVGDVELVAINLQIEPSTNENQPGLCVCKNGFAIENTPPFSADAIKFRTCNP